MKQNGKISEDKALKDVVILWMLNIKCKKELNYE